jgi:hypothetical protein
MGVLDGSPVNAANSNAAWMDKNQNTYTTGIVSLMAPTSISGPFVTDVQNAINSFVSGASGVTSIAGNSGTNLVGAVNLAPSGATVIQSVGQNIRIYSPASGTAVNTLAASGSSGLTGSVTLSSSGGVTLTQSGQNIQIFTPTTSNLTIGTIDSQADSTNGAVISGNSLYMQSASGSFPGLVNANAQTFTGAKAFATSVSAVSVSAGSIVDNQVQAAGVIFGATNGLLKTDANNLYFDDTNYFLGIGLSGGTPNAPLEVGNGGAVRLDGTSGHITMQPAATTTSYTIILPSAQGAASSHIQNNGSGTLSWVATVNSLSGASGTALTGAVNLSASGATVITESGQNIIIYSPASGNAVSSFSASGQTALTGAVTISAGSNITLTQSGQNIAIAAAGGGGGGGSVATSIATSGIDYVRAYGGASGWASTNTYIRNFSTIQVQTSNGVVNYASNASLGAGVTATVKCLATITYYDSEESSNSNYFGLSLNSTQLSQKIFDGVTTIAASAILSMAAALGGAATNAPGGCTVSVIMQAGDVIRPHTSYNTGLGNAGPVGFVVTAIPLTG